MRTTKRVAVGRDMFSTIIDGNFYYVDKTRFLRPVLYSDSQVLLCIYHSGQCHALYPSPPLWQDPDHEHDP